MFDFSAACRFKPSQPESEEGTRTLQKNAKPSIANSNPRKLAILYINGIHVEKNLNKIFKKIKGRGLLRELTSTTMRHLHTEGHLK